MIKLSKLKPNPNNPRDITLDKLSDLKDSINGFPRMMELNPIKVDENWEILAGHQRLKALKELGFKEVEKKWVVQIKGLSDSEKKEYLARDNSNQGHWLWEKFEDEYWQDEPWQDWVESNEKPIGIDDIETSDEFTLPSGDKEPFQQMTFTLADEQAEIIKQRIAEIKKKDEYKYCETFGNENGNGNALYLLVNG